MTTDMKMSEQGVHLLTQWEGFKTKIYKDSAGLPTIGVGHLLTRDELTSGKIYIKSICGLVELPIRYASGLTNEQVEALLKQDLAKFEKAVNDLVTVELTQYQFDALVSFAFNVGIGSFKNSTLLKRVNAKMFSEVPTQFLRWTYAGGKQIKGLINRRNNEIALWVGQLTEAQ
jgi:lysozyme